MALEDHLLTEALNPLSEGLDTLSASEIVVLMNAEDAKAVEAVRAVSASIARGVEVIADRFRRGGRLIYVGAGTSGRLGVLDASECPPTFNTPPSMVVGLIAGGLTALTRAVEGAEDDRGQGRLEIQALGVSSRDVVVGIATSGRTPYVLGAVEAARAAGAFTIGLACNRPSLLGELVDLEIAPLVGPEVLAGSTRLKAGTATKLVLNTLTTGAMVLIGKTLGNRMVDLQPTNEKLRIRTRRILRELAGIEEDEAARLLDRCSGNLKRALVAALAGVEPARAAELLERHGGQVRRAVAGRDRRGRRMMAAYCSSESTAEGPRRPPGWPTRTGGSSAGGSQGRRTSRRSAPKPRGPGSTARSARRSPTPASKTGPSRPRASAWPGSTGPRTRPGSRPGPPARPGPAGWCWSMTATWSSRRGPPRAGAWA